MTTILMMVLLESVTSKKIKVGERCQNRDRLIMGNNWCCRGLHLGSILLQCLSVYLFSFLLCHVLIVYIIDSIV